MPPAEFEPTIPASEGQRESAAFDNTRLKINTWGRELAKAEKSKHVDNHGRLLTPVSQALAAAAAWAACKCLMSNNACILSRLWEVGVYQRPRSRNSVFPTRSAGNCGFIQRAVTTPP
jgi:hypothetical protein